MRKYHRDRRTESSELALSLVTVFGYGLVIALTHPMWDGCIFLLPWCLLPATEAASGRERGETAGSCNYRERDENLIVEGFPPKTSLCYYQTVLEL
jgi:hypothetical protein